jgi:hypothetical protein
MEDLMVYLLKSTLIIAVFYGIYYVFLRNEIFYQFNRLFLLTGLLASIVLPLYNYSYEVIIRIAAPAAEVSTVINRPDNTNMLPAWTYIMISIYILLSCFFIFRHLSGLIHLKKMVLKYGYTWLEGYKVINTPVFKSSFSVFNYIFIDASEYTSVAEKELILAHELAHVKQAHWADLLIAQLCCALQWFNPLIWLYLDAVKQNHEFLADAAVLAQGSSPARYRAALINHSLQTRVFSFASSFATTDKFKRIRMMMKSESNPLKKTAVLLVLPAIATILYAFAEPQYTLLPAIGVKKALNAVKSQTIKTADPADLATKPLNILILTRGEKKVPQKNAKFFRRITIVNHSETKQSKSVPADSVQDSPLTVKSDPKVITIISRRSPGTAIPMIILDGVEVKSMESLNPANIESISVFKGETAIKKYGEAGSDGVIEVKSKAKPTE